MNKVNDLKIELNQYPYMDNKLYVSLGIHAGFAYKEYVLLKDRSKRIAMNQASANVFMEYTRLKLAKYIGKVVRTNTTTNASVLTFLTTARTFDNDLKNVLTHFYATEIEEDLFQEAKANCMENFKKNYKEVEFRVYTKMLEFMDVQKGFHYSDLAKDIQQIERTDLQQFAQLFLNFPNTSILINGNTDKIKEADFFYWLNDTQKPGDVVIPSAHLMKEKPVADQHLVKEDKDRYQGGAIHFDFNPELVPLHDQFALLQLVGHTLFKRNFAISVDLLDASILYQQVDLQEYKENIIVSLTQENVKEACLAIQEEVEYLLVEKPYQFNTWFMGLYMNGIDLIKYYVTIKTYPVEFVKQIMSKQVDSVAECQIVFKEREKVYYV